eukprot:m.245242 g.245242  ORF g.245242 m.245242 type:complete len:154 (-) comp19049_c1_seq8:32-493(-)
MVLLLVERSIVHRNLCSKNVLVDRDHCCRLTGFGLACELTEGDQVEGSKDGIQLRWLSPEILQEAFVSETLHFSLKSDVWAFGITVTEIWMDGGAPFPDLQDKEVVEVVVGGDPHQQPEHMPDAVYDLLCRCRKKSEQCLGCVWACVGVCVFL